MLKPKSEDDSAKLLKQNATLVLKLRLPFTQGSSASLVQKNSSNAMHISRPANVEKQSNVETETEGFCQQNLTTSVQNSSSAFIQLNKPTVTEKQSNVKIGAEGLFQQNTTSVQDTSSAFTQFSKPTVTEKQSNVKIGAEGLFQQNITSVQDTSSAFTQFSKPTVTEKQPIANIDMEGFFQQNCAAFQSTNSAFTQYNRPMTLENRLDVAHQFISPFPGSLNCISAVIVPQQDPSMQQIKCNQNVLENKKINNEMVDIQTKVSTTPPTVVILKSNSTDVPAKCIPVSLLLSKKGIANTTSPVINTSTNSTIQQNSNIAPKLPETVAMTQKASTKAHSKNKPSKNSLPTASLFRIPDYCSCTTSHCVKRYCVCFSKGQLCNKFCKCNNCFNNINHEEQRQKHVKDALQKDKDAFKPRICEDTLKSVQYHTRGCKCKASFCQKKYCECYEANIFCCKLCKCKNCCNTNEKYCSKQNPVSKVPKTFRFIAVTEKIAEAVGLCMLSQALKAETAGFATAGVEKKILEEFSSTITQILEFQQKHFHKPP